uniref:Gamma-secretase subunit PEN-2 n=1 Tax=Lygus hesperus TaxID=30085 RepID=A0A0A9VWP5_LYGHE
MDLSKVNNEDKLKLCRWYFKAGFFCLPFVWLINSIWFFKDAFLKPEYDEQKSIRKLVIWSAIGALVWAIAVASWVTTYQTHRVAWGEFGDLISVVTPTGSA